MPVEMHGTPTTLAKIWPIYAFNTYLLKLSIPPTWRCVTSVTSPYAYGTEFINDAVSTHYKIFYVAGPDLRGTMGLGPRFPLTEGLPSSRSFVNFLYP